MTNPCEFLARHDEATASFDERWRSGDTTENTTTTTTNATTTTATATSRETSERTTTQGGSGCCYSFWSGAISPPTTTPMLTTRNQDSDNNSSSNGYAPFLRPLPAIRVADLMTEREEEDEDDATMDAEVETSKSTTTSTYSGFFVQDFSNLSLDSHPTTSSTHRSEEVNSDSSSSTTHHTTQEMLDNLLLFTPDQDGDTSLHISILQEDERQSLEIIKRAPDFVHLNIANSLGQTPVHIAALTNSSTTIRKLVCAGASVRSQDRFGNTALHIACAQGYLEIVKKLLRPVYYEETLGNTYEIPFVAMPQHMCVKNYDGLTCLHLAVLNRHFDIARLLMEAGADANLGDSKSGRSPLHMAAEEGMADIAALLVSYRYTRVDVENYAGYTPAELAHSRGHVEMAEWLAGTTGSFFYSSPRL